MSRYTQEGFKDYRTPTSECPKCTRTMSAAAQATGKKNRPPKPGDLTICAYCQAFLSFDDDLHVQELTPRMLAQLPDDLQTELRRIRAKLERMASTGATH